MAKRRPTALRAHASLPARGNFRDRYDDLETRREQLVKRLRLLGEITQKHPGYKRALTLLNDTFRKSRLAQRLAVLQAATWLIDILEQVTTVL
jgi:sporulation-control protein spo0M